MLFKKSLVDRILSGEKTVTRCLRRSKKGLGDKMAIRIGMDKPIAYVLITRKFRQKLGDMTLEDAHKEGFKDIEIFKDVWTKIYGKWGSEQVVWAFEFKLVEDASLDLTSKDKLSQQACMQLEGIPVPSDFGIPIHPGVLFMYFRYAFPYFSRQKRSSGIIIETEMKNRT